MHLKSILVFMVCVFAAPGFGRAAEAPACHVGTYGLAGGNLVDVASEGDGLRWRTLDGRTGLLRPVADGSRWKSTLGWTNEPDGVRVAFAGCAAGVVRFDGRVGRRIELAVTETSFTRDGVRFRARLVTPRKLEGGLTVMVLGHGSERWSAVDGAFRQRLYAAAGLGVFVFDKRGTGKSEGAYTQDFQVLADDMAAAVAKARELVGPRLSRIGLQGGSQAGWVLPLTAARAPVDYVIVGYGIAASPTVEDRTETLQDLARAGWGPDVLAKAAEVTDATAEIIGSRFTSGYERLEAVRERYGKEPWFADLKGEYTGEMVRHTEAEIRTIGPSLDEGTPWRHDAVAALHANPSPLLWFIAAEDTEGAGPETPRALTTLRAEGRPVTPVMVANAEHGLHVIDAPKGARRHIRYAPGYFEMELDFARHGRLTASYPGMEILAGETPD